MIREIHFNSIEFSTNIKKTIRKAIQDIEDCIDKKSLAIENKLPLQLIGNHLIRGTKSASVQASHPLAYLKSTIAHANRKKQAREAYQNYLPVLLATIELRRPSSVEIRCLTAVPKRYPESDFNAQSRHYPQLMKHLQVTIYLIRKSSRDLCENVGLLRICR
jgi:hypothetical protein